LGRKAARSGDVKSAAFRAFLVFLLIASVAIRFRAIQDRNDIIAGYDPSAAIADVLKTSGLQLGENPVPSPKLLSVVVYFQRPGCGRLSYAMPFRLNVQALPMIRRVADAGYRFRFYYFDGSWAEQDRWVLFRYWLKQAALAMVGASRYIPAVTAMVLAEPENCAAPQTVDWQSVWERERQRKAMEKKTTRLSSRHVALGNVR
jgi:hypothetical protein